MFDGVTGPDPYVFYKIHHVDRARYAWILSEDLGIYEVFRNGPKTIAEVCEETGLQARPIAALLAANACMGILGIKDGKYFLYDIMREFLLEDGRARYKPEIPQRGEDQHYDIFRQAVLTNQPVREYMPPWQTHPRGAPGITAFAPGRHGWRILWGEALANAFDFSPYRCVADLGGATGGVLVALTLKYPKLKGIVFDLPYSKESAEAAVGASQASDRVKFMAGDFFKDPYPEGVDVFFMSHIIHDWDDEHCLEILRNCYEALPSGCPVIVQEFLLNEDKTGSLLAVFQGFGLLRGTIGDQRTSKEISELMEASGFHNMETKPIDKDQSIVVGWKE